MSISNENVSKDLKLKQVHLKIEPIGRLPMKRKLEPQNMKLRETTILPRELRLSELEEGEAILRVQIIGINYLTDFEWFRNKSNRPARVVPGNKIIGKLSLARGFDFERNSKYLVFPYSNCILQNVNLCRNCMELTVQNKALLTEDTYSVHSEYECLRGLAYGSTLEGGLQDYMKIKNANETLIKIPECVSLHDCCFSLDITLPFFSFVKDNRHLFESENLKGKFLIILNDISKELNDVLLVIEHFQLDRKTIHFLDYKIIKELTDSAKEVYESKFNHVLAFNDSELTFQFSTVSIISTSLESIRSRFSIILFDQYNPRSRSLVEHLNNKHPDITISQFKLSYKDKLNAIELIHVISSMNNKTDELDFAKQSNILSPKSASRIVASLNKYNEPVFTSSSTINEQIIGQEAQSKCMHLKDDDSVTSNKKKLKTSSLSWLWSGIDFYLCNEFDRSNISDEVDPANVKIHSIVQINKLIRNPKQVSRVCYSNRSVKAEHINGVIIA